MVPKVKYGKLDVPSKMLVASTNMPFDSLAVELEMVPILDSLTYAMVG